MADIIPFKAVRPSADKVALVTTRPYDEYSAAELASWLDFNPFSFLHIVNLAFINQEKIDPIRRYKMVATKYSDFKRDGILIQDEKPAMYLHQIISKKNNFIGILAGTSLQDYQTNVIKKHENTLDYRVENLKDYFNETRFNAEPVLMMYPNCEDLQHWIQQKREQTPLYDFSTTNRERHIVWKIESDEELQFVQNAFKQMPNLYIADGHHRSATSDLLLNENGDRASDNMHHFMSYLICETTIQINEYNRLVHDLNGMQSEDFLAILEKDFTVKKVHEYWKPQKKYSFGMYLDGVFYSLKLKNIPAEDNIINTLDPQILYDTILQPLLNITDLRTDSRISYIPGNKNIMELVNKIDNGDYKVGFILYPSSIDEIKTLADNNLTMPPKSTYIEPKFRNGLIIYEFQ
ncbi:DUF1015 domain-containing protein [Flavobacterium sp. xlx-214]|uniref:DUF1015 domain-containing protein n=1 Tax=unclassified Flavobacterium TaxID=196869 RepID=UPI0013D15764|nr:MULTISPECIES: DUF1015 domain-containing protein [unclassified Flavobacterium]MBA5791857.1 DUF1015 domain-containing protein [Flavobacterium sp. xlx-221]QMI83094.1 DUF1015 domain-containing protein [Flavobacterium sp. xlx-214]